MLVTCQHCNTTYNLPDDKAVKGAKLRCTVCKNVFELNDEVVEDKQNKKESVKSKTQTEDSSAQKNSAERPSDDAEQKESQKNQEIIDEDFTPPPPAHRGTHNPKDDELAQDAIRKKSKLRANKISLKTASLIFVFLLVVSGTFWGIFSYTSLLDMLKTDPMTEQLQASALLEEKVQLLELRNVRQYSVDNDKIGTLQVIEGRVINGFNTPRAMIEVEATLYDAEGAKLLSSNQLAGTTLSLFQLQVLGKEEILQILSNTVDINANNGYIPPNGMTPFMIIFFETPLLAQEYSIKVVSAQSPVVQEK